MAKNKTVYACSECGYQTAKWMGHCPECGAWNTFSEQTVKQQKAAAQKVRVHCSVPLASLTLEAEERLVCANAELNRVLGGGLIRGSSILVGGEPGIGKSTLMLHLAADFSEKALYVSGEESARQIKMRADRLKLRGNPEIYCETDLESILVLADKLKPRLVVVDSIQTLRSATIDSIAAGPNQLRYCCDALVSWAKTTQAALFLVAHVTKEGAIAGPKMIEHLVDTVLYFDNSASDLRFLRSTKNRFGSVDEIGLFTMTAEGIKQVTDPAELFLSPRRSQIPAGIAIAAIHEGSRTFLIELQALTVPAKSGLSRVFSDLIDPRRVGRLAAVLEKHLNLRFSDQDIFVNVAGGLRIKDTGLDLPLAMALYSARANLPLPPRLALAGELSLAGEVMPVTQLPRRRKTAAEWGFNKFVGPRSKGLKNDYSSVETLKNCLQEVLKNG